jgi:hypothetical protein
VWPKTGPGHCPEQELIALRPLMFLLATEAMNAFGLDPILALRTE